VTAFARLAGVTCGSADPVSEMAAFDSGEGRPLRAAETADQPPAQARRARPMLYAGVEAESADLAGRQSLRWVWNELGYGGSYFGDVPEGGCRRLVDAMAFGIDVRLGRPVTEIEASPDGVRVRIADGPVGEGSHVVVTVPLSVLKRRPATVLPGVAAGSAGGNRAARVRPVREGSPAVQ
jgi:protoporphyrinogen oxidase